ncbi:helix-turn-helix domain-containing protein [Streptomyces cellulosae]|uniref:Helix-turn-helix domain-containing protein n=1 Tax=Streptomyces cellulosae TaxID=1968 RepID=A0ABW7YDG4_STRCE
MVARRPNGPAGEGWRFARGDRTSDIAKDLRVSERSVEQWRRNWREGGRSARSRWLRRPCPARRRRGGR